VSNRLGPITDLEVYSINIRNNLKGKQIDAANIISSTNSKDEESRMQHGKYIYIYINKEMNESELEN